ncbi:WD domain, G-beta repeat protein [Trichuris suis]|uniref:Uncharacterized protein n=1 Tax=Trichuris suis TaxID=68888 RepID=A0A085M5H0_9BILA|nr:hypothetical protein M513_06663 [Trichuris suis]KHJ40735.1 WD domain, G-beta repeat protein [Trichuris suis]
MDRQQHKLIIKQLKSIQKHPDVAYSSEADQLGGCPSLITISRSFGVIIVAYGSELLVLEAKRLLQSETPSLAGLIVQRLSSPSNVVSIQCDSDGSLLAVCLNNNDSPLALIFSVKALAEGIFQPICQIPLSDVSGDRLLSLKWNPGETDYLLSLCKNTGVRLYKIAKSGSVTALGRIGGNSSILCADWSPKGKQFVVGLRDGSIVQYKMNCQVYRAFSRPSSKTLVSAIDIAWVLPREFFVLYSTDMATKCSMAVLASSSKERPTELKFLEFDQCTFLPPTIYDVRRFFLSYLSDIPLLLCSASAAHTLQAFVRDQSDTWHLCQTVQPGGTPLPVQKSGSNADPVLGLVLDPIEQVNAQRADNQSGSTGDHSVILYSTDGTLLWLQLSYSVDKSDSQPLASLANMVVKATQPTVGQQQPSAAAEATKQPLPARGVPISSAVSNIVASEDHYTPEMFQELIRSYEEEFVKVRNELFDHFNVNAFGDTTAVGLACQMEQAAKVSDALKSLRGDVSQLNSVAMNQFSTVEALRAYLNKQSRGTLSRNVALLPSVSEVTENIRKNFSIVEEKLSSIETWLDKCEDDVDASPEIIPQNAVKTSMMSMINNTANHLERLIVEAEKKVATTQKSSELDGSSVDERSTSEIVDQLSISMSKLDSWISDASKCSDFSNEPNPLVGLKKSFEEQLLMARFAKDSAIQRTTVVPAPSDVVDLKGRLVEDVSESDSAKLTDSKFGIQHKLQGKSAALNMQQPSSSMSNSLQAVNAKLESSYLSALSPPFKETEELAKCAESLLMDELVGLRVMESDYDFATLAKPTVVGEAAVLKNGSPSMGATVTSKGIVASGAAAQPIFSNVSPLANNETRRQTDSSFTRFHWTKEPKDALQAAKPEAPKGKEPSVATTIKAGAASSVFPTVRKESPLPPILPKQDAIASAQKSASQPKPAVSVKTSQQKDVTKVDKPKALFTAAKSSSSAESKSKEPIVPSFTVTTTAAVAVSAAPGGSIFSNLNTQDNKQASVPIGASLFSMTANVESKAAPPESSKDQSSLTTKEVAKDSALPSTAVEAKGGEKPITFSFGTSAVQAALAKKSEENEAEMDSSEITADAGAKAPTSEALPNFSFKLEDHNISPAITGVGFFSGLGAKPKPEMAQKNIFAGGMSLGSPAPSASKGLFGTTPSGASPFSTAFGSSQSGSSSFGGSLFGSSSSQSTAFGVTSAASPLQASTTPGGFGSQPTFGGTAFGAQPVFGGGSLFGGPASFAQSTSAGGFSAPPTGSSSKMCLLFQRFSVLSAPAAERGVSFLWKRAYGADLQLAGALRSFYFLVHPDFFSRHPHMRATNEESLKVLQRYYLDLGKPDYPPRSTKSLKFFVRPTEATQDTVRVIYVDLVDTDPRLLVKSLLSKCNLPDHIPMDGVVSKRSEVPASLYCRRRSGNSLMEWMGKLTAEAELQSKRADLTNDQNVRLTERLCTMYKLRDIVWGDHFSRQLFLPSLNSLHRALHCFPEVAPTLNGLVVKFDKNNCVSADGNIVLNPLDVSERWLSVLVSLSNCKDDISSRVAAVIQEISICLSGINIIAPKSSCVFRWLDLCDQIVDRFKRSSVKIYPDQRYCMLNASVMDDSECDLCVTSTGLLMVPSGISPSRMQNFLYSNADRALETQCHFQATIKEVTELRHRIIDKHSLRVFTFDDSGNLDRLTASLRRLLCIEQSVSDCLKGQRLHLAGSAYSILWDGRIVVPLDWQ